MRRCSPACRCIFFIWPEDGPERGQNVHVQVPVQVQAGRRHGRSDALGLGRPFGRYFIQQGLSSAGKRLRQGKAEAAQAVPEKAVGPGEQGQPVWRQQTSAFQKIQMHADHGQAVAARQGSFQSAGGPLGTVAAGHDRGARQGAGAVQNARGDSVGEAAVVGVGDNPHGG